MIHCVAALEAHDGTRSSMGEQCLLQNHTYLSNDAIRNRPGDLKYFELKHYVIYVVAF